MLTEQEKQEEESLQSMLYRTSMNTFHRAEIFCKKTERNAKLAVKKLQLRQVKKTFGVDYMTLLEKDANPDELEQCMRDGHEKMGNINKDIRTLRAEKTSLDDLLQQKLVRKPTAQTEEGVEPAHFQYTPNAEESSEAKVPASKDDESAEKSDDDGKTTHAEDVVDDAQANTSTVEPNENPDRRPSDGQEDEFVVLPTSREMSWVVKF